MSGVIVATSFAVHILNFHGPWAYALVGGLCFSESAFIITFFLPGETALVFGGVLASEHHVSLAVMILVAICSTTAGYFAGFAIGRFFGPRVLDVQFVRGRPGIDRTKATIVQRGGWAVMIARFIPVVRAFMPAVAGATGVDGVVFAKANVVGAVVWGSAYVCAGFLVSQAYQRFVKDAATVGEALAAAVAVVLVALYIRARRRGKGAPERSD